MFKKTFIALRIVSALMVPVALFGAFGAYLAGDIFAIGICSFFATKMFVIAVTAS